MENMSLKTEAKKMENAQYRPSNGVHEAMID